MNEVLEQLVAYDKQIAYRQEPGAGESWFNVHYGDAPVLLSAPHACMHLRDGEPKMEEEFTAAYALALAKETGCHAIYVKNKTKEDPNWQAGGIYKEAVRGLVRDRAIRFVIDLHGMTDQHRMGVAIGTMQGVSCPGIDVADSFIAEGFVQTRANQLAESTDAQWRRVVVDHPRFTGGIRNQTITRFAVQQLNIKALQVELASACRVVYSPATDDWPVEYSGEPNAIESSFRALQSMIEQVVSHEY